MLPKLSSSRMMSAASRATSEPSRPIAIAMLACRTEPNQTKGAVQAEGRGRVRIGVSVRVGLFLPTVVQRRQDEAALFCLVGVTFLCSSYVQEKRGHIGISAIEGLLFKCYGR